jgi:hypothetical protein
MKNKIIIGETCLLDKQLRRCGIINGPHGLFDNVLINLDGVKYIIENDFSYILDRNFLINESYNYYPKHNIIYSKWINKKYSIDRDNIYSWNVMSFFHLDNINNLDSLCRKLNRTKSWLEDSNDVVMFYYYRRSDKYNTQKHENKIINFSNFINKKYNKTIKIVNFNNLIGESHYDIKMFEELILSIDIYSKNCWTDIDDNWDAHTDNFLFDKIFNCQKFLEFVK